MNMQHAEAMGFRSGMSWADVAKRVSEIETARGEWAGFPMPLAGLGLVTESKYPHGARVAQLQALVDSEPGRVHPKKEQYDEGAVGVNRWRTTLRGTDGDVVIYRKDGKTGWYFDPSVVRRNGFLLGPLATLDAWNLDTECTALDSLADLLTERMYAAYVLTGSFLETSKRSGLTYLFRRLRPTVVLTPHRDRSNMAILCALCLHPIAYYHGSFCGAMTPTDDVIAHLLLMRGDEKLYWRRANQHPPHAPESGL